MYNLHGNQGDNEYCTKGLTIGRSPKKVEGGIT